jgi:hypothetical protein
VSKSQQQPLSQGRPHLASGTQNDSVTLKLARKGDVRFAWLDQQLVELLLGVDSDHSEKMNVTDRRQGEALAAGVSDSCIFGPKFRNANMWFE